MSQLVSRRPNPIASTDALKAINATSKHPIRAAIPYFNGPENSRSRNRLADMIDSTTRLTVRALI
jgi:hypothetical protein